MKSLKTPLRYPGGKSRAVKYLIPKMPKDIVEYREPFIGGGSVAIAFTKEYPDIPVWVNDLYKPLVIFWQQLQQYGEEIKDHLLHFKNACPDPVSARGLFDISKQILNDPNTGDFERAVRFYIVNKCSFSGLTESSSFSPQASNSNFSVRGIEKLPEYSKLIQNWKITCGPYWDMMMTSAPVGTFWFFDPPYDIKDNLYGKKGELHKGFNHEEFHAWITQGNVKDRWMITYNTNPTLMEWYDGYYQTKWDLTYTMRSVGDYMNEQKDRAELLITNYDETISNGIFEFNKSKQEVGSY
jgi:site-specific DNA-adenine methylase